MPAMESERGTVASSTFATAEILTPSPTENGDNKMVESSGRVTKVTTTHYTTKTVTTRMAIGNEREITAVMAATAGSHQPLSTIPHIDDGDHPGAVAVSRKVSFPADNNALPSARPSDAHPAGSTSAYSGRLLKYGYRLLGDSWHPVNITISREGVVEWTSDRSDQHTHIIRLHELPAGMVAIGRSCLEIPAYLSPKLKKGLNPDYIIAMGRHRNGKVKSYWFAAEGEEEFQRVKAVLGQIVGYQAVNLEGSEVRRVWMGQQGQGQGEVNVGGLSALPPAVVTSSADGGTVVSHRETVTYVRDAPAAADGGEHNGGAMTPRRKQKSAKEAFFESK